MLGCASHLFLPGSLPFRQGRGRHVYGDPKKSAMQEPKSPPLWRASSHWGKWQRSPRPTFSTRFTYNVCSLPLQSWWDVNSWEEGCDLWCSLFSPQINEWPDKQQIHDSANLPFHTILKFHVYVAVLSLLFCSGFDGFILLLLFVLSFLLSSKFFEGRTHEFLYF